MNSMDQDIKVEEITFSDDPIKSLKSMQENILNKMQVLEGLNTDYKNKQEKQFLKTFMNIMDKMSTQLMVAKEKYRNIDKEIERDQKCVKLTNQLNFFKDQCVALRHQLLQAQNELDNERYATEQLEKERNQLNRNLMKKSKQAFRYRSRLMSLQKRQISSNNNKSYQVQQVTPDRNNRNRSNQRTFFDDKSSFKKTWYSYNIQNDLNGSSTGNKTLYSGFGVGQEQSRKSKLRKKL